MAVGDGGLLRLAPEAGQALAGFGGETDNHALHRAVGLRSAAFGMTFVWAARTERQDGWRVLALPGTRVGIRDAGVARHTSGPYPPLLVHLGGAVACATTAHWANSLCPHHQCRRT